MVDNENILHVKVLQVMLRRKYLKKKFSMVPKTQNEKNSFKDLLLRKSLWKNLFIT